jgi:hypothetical protein
VRMIDFQNTIGLLILKGILLSGLLMALYGYR